MGIVFQPFGDANPLGTGDDDCLVTSFEVRGAHDSQASADPEPLVSTADLEAALDEHGSELTGTGRDRFEQGEIARLEDAQRNRAVREDHTSQGEHGETGRHGGDPTPVQGRSTMQDP